MFAFPILKKTSVYGLTYDYLSACFGNKVDAKEQSNVLQKFTRILDSGWCSDDIYSVLNKAYQNNKSMFFDIDSLYNFCTSTQPPKQNLLNTDMYRTHQALQLTSTAPKINYSPDVLNIFEIVECEYYLEPIASFAMEDLVEYILKQSKYILIENNNAKKLNGALTYMLTNWGNVNVVLFAFDRTIAHCKLNGKKLKDMFDMSEFLEEAINTNNRIINQIKNGDIEFVQKHRLLFS